ncbi:MAG: M20/M25/M40 family metallo-hydrolase [Devosia sp.]
MATLDGSIEAHAESAFAFLEALVRSPSTAGREQGALEVFASEMVALGLAVRRLPFANGHVSHPSAGIAVPHEVASPDRFQVLATTLGDGHLDLLLNGHIDVVPADSPQLWTTPPFAPARRDGKMFGRGAADMKSGLAVGALALRALRDVKPDLFAKHRLGFIAVIEEECTGNGTLRSVTDHKVTANEVVLLEPTDLGLLVGGVGVLWVDAEIAAQAGHAHDATAHSSAIDLGLKLVERLSHWSEEIGRGWPEPSMPSNRNPYALNIGKINAGDWTSSVASHAVFSLRIGYPRAWTPERAEVEVRNVIRSFSETSGFAIPPTVRLTGFRAQGYLLEHDTTLVRDLSAAHRAAHGNDPAVYSLGSTTDARTYLNEAGIPAVCYGAVAHNMHGIDEAVELRSIIDAAKTLARFILMRFDPAGETP